MPEAAGPVGPADAGRVHRFSRVVGGDVAEVSPACDRAEITAIAAAHVLYDLVTIMAAPGRT